MNTETTQQTEDYIPDANEVQRPTGGRKTYRFSEGRIITGREETGIEELTQVIGRLRRVGVFKGQSQDGSTYYEQLEADVETAQGMIRVKGSITNKEQQIAPPVSTLGFAEGLLEIAKDELFSITANLASKPNKYGKKPTYVNLYHVDASVRPARTKEVRRRPFDKNDTRGAAERWADLEKEILTHAAYAERAISESDDEDGNATTHLSALCKECEAKGWPTPEVAPTPWLGMVSKFFKEAKPREKLTSYTDDEWGMVREALSQVTDMPPALADVKPNKPIEQKAPDAGAFK